MNYVDKTLLIVSITSLSIIAIISAIVPNIIYNWFNDKKKRKK
jgi:hypothetical protein